MADKRLFAFLLLSSYSIQVPGCTPTRSANQHRPRFHTKSWPGSKCTCNCLIYIHTYNSQGQRHGGHPRKVNNIVPFSLYLDREYSTILDDADFANFINFVPSQGFHHDDLGETFLEVNDNEIKLVNGTKTSFRFRPDFK